MRTTVFFHCHKAGGTTVVEAALRSGLKLPAAHANGNPVGADGELINWRALSEAATVETITRFRDEGVGFFCVEHTVPRWPALRRIDGLEFVTVLREPQARAFSNFRMDVLNRLVTLKKGTDFAAYMNDRSLFRSHNFYTRFFARIAAGVELTDDHFARALAVLDRFAAVCILERGNLGERLAPFGFAPEAFGWKNVNARKKRFVTYDVEATGVDIVTFPQTAEFHRLNAYDSALYSQFLHKDMETSLKADLARQAQDGSGAVSGP